MIRLTVYLYVFVLFFILFDSVKADVLTTKEMKLGARMCTINTLTITDSICSSKDCIQTDKIVHIVCDKRGN